MPAEPRLERSRQLVHAESESDAVERLDRLTAASRDGGRARHDPEPSAARPGVRKVGIAGGQPAEARAGSQTGVQAIGKRLRTAALIAPRAGEQDLPNFPPLGDPRLRIRVERVTPERTCIPGRKDTNRDHVTRDDSEPLGG